MAALLTSDAFVELVRKSGLIEQDRLDSYLEQVRAHAPLPAEPKQLATVLIRDGFLSYFQAKELLKGKYRGFTIGKYKILERLGFGGNSSVFLCAHLSMRRRVVLKILPLAKAEDPSALARFYREARAAGALDHPNIVRTYDNGKEGNLHFLVMEYVDGSSLDEIVQKHGPMDIARAAAYIRQATIGLQHMHHAGLIHRDIKPGNILLERRGIVKILDLGLARFFHDHKDTLTQQYKHTTILGTADYLSPEQALDSHDADTRTDIYSLGATFYFLLAGRPPFKATAVSQKVLSHLMKEPTPLRELRPDVPEALAAIVSRMMAKDREQRYQNAAAVVVALTPWTQTPITRPPPHEMPQLCLAARSADSVEAGPVSVSGKRNAQKTNTSQASFDREGAKAQALMARIEPGQASGRSTSRRLNPIPIKPPPCRREAPMPAPLATPPPDRRQRAPGQRQAGDTVSSISGIDTRSDLLEGFRRRPATGQPAPAKSAQWQRKQLRKLAVVSMVVAVVGGFALHVLFSRSSAPSGPQKPFPGTIRPKVPNPKKDRPRELSVGVSVSSPSTQARAGVP